MKNLTDFRKTVETGVDPRLLIMVKTPSLIEAQYTVECYYCPGQGLRRYEL